VNALATTTATTDERALMTGTGDQTVTFTTPWWYGVKGLDPGNPTNDIAQAARLTAIACAVHAMGTDLVIHRDRTSWALRRNKAVQEVRAWYEWLAEPGDHLEAYARRVTLGWVCDLPIPDYTFVLPTAMALCEAAPAPPPPEGTPS
jgi:hypothetical protein